MTIQQMLLSVVVDSSVPVTPDVFDPSALGPGASLSVGNTRATMTGTGNCRIASGKSSGKWQVEFVTASDLDLYSIIGFGTPSTSTTGFCGSHADSWGYWNRTGNKYNNNASSSYGASFSVSIIIGLVFDASAGTVTMYRNGTSQGVMASGLSGTIVPMVGNGGGGSNLIIDVLTTLVYPVAGATQWGTPI